MISLARKAGRRALHLQQHGRYTVISTRSYRSCLSISKQSCILRPLAISNNRSWYLPRTHHVAYNFSTEVGDVEETNIKLPLLINANEQLDKIYASPATLMSQNGISVLKRDCKTMRVTNKDGEDEVWYTATYTIELKKAEKVEEHNSGKFTSFIQQRIDQNNTWCSEETLIVDGKVYYKDQNIAFESAAARMLDTIAYSLKYKPSNRRRFGAHLATKMEPIRYCVEAPLLFDQEKRYHCSHAPTYYLKILLQDMYGPIDDVQFIVDVHSEFDDWYTATFTEPVTKEVFNAGVFGLGMISNSDLPEAPTTPLPLEEMIIHDGRVYYRDESVARHAAAARALDCLNFRINNDQHNQLCLEIPYSLEDKDKIIPANYEELREIVNARRRGKSGFSWSDLLDSKDMSNLRLKGVLLDGISAQYGSLFNKRGMRGSLGKLFNVDSFENEDGIWYTSIFFDPVTKERFASGFVQAKYSLSYYENVECKVFDGKVYYNRGNLAEHAAAARALDCYLFRENKNTRGRASVPFCLEEPYMTTEEGKAQSFDYDALVNQWNDQLAAIKEISLASSDLKVEKSHNMSSSQETQSTEDSHIGRVLSSLPPHYRHVPKSMLETGLARHNKTGFSHLPTYDIETTSFEGRKWFTATVQTPISNERHVSGIGRVVSAKKNQSASLKVPLHKAETKVIDGKVYYSSPRLAEHAAAARAIDCYIFRSKPTGIHDRLCVEQPYMNLLDAERPPPTEANESTLELVPANNKPDLRPSTTMGRIAEIWTGLDAVVSRQPGPGINIESILNWYKQAYQEPQSPDEAMVSAQLLNKVLTALGEAQRRESSYINVEKEARSIRDKIISLSITFGGDIVVDASVFNSYINCLNRFDSKSSALFARDLLMKMQRQELFNGITLPLPTIETYNAVMRICAFVDKTHVNVVYKLLSEEGNGYHLSPNKDTVKIMLAANSTVNSSFCFDSALSCLSQTQQTSGMIPDADIYSAALGSLPQTLENDSPYKSGFKEHDESSNQEASDIAKWIIYAEESGVKPNAEMYEHIIHACTKIGTKTGLLMAEDWAGRAIASGSAIRLATFEPIITAWSLCGIPQRVEQWITQLDALSESNINLRPDLGTHSLYMKALRNVQAGIIDRVIEETDNSDEETAECVKQVFIHAKLCTSYLNKMLLTSMSKLDSQQDVDAMSSMFKTTLEACGCASRLSLESPTTLEDESHESHNTAMLDVASLIKVDDNGQDDELSQKILEIMGEAYVETISQLHQTASVAASVDVADNEVSYFPLLEVEKLIRDYDDYSQKLLGDARDIDLRFHLYEEVLTGCSSGIKSSDTEHVIRIIKVILEQIAHLNSKTAKNSREMVELTDLFTSCVLLTKTAVEAPQDRTVILTEIWDNAKPFFYRRVGGSGLGIVERAKLIGYIRTALDDTDSDVIEDFLSTFEQKRGKKNGWLGAPFHYYN